MATISHRMLNAFIPNTRHIHKEMMLKIFITQLNDVVSITLHYGYAHAQFWSVILMIMIIHLIVNTWNKR